MSGRAELGAVGHLQAEMLHLELIDGADGYRGDTESSKASAVAAPTVATKDSVAPVTMDTYRPKRPTTLNLFPIVPRTQVSPPPPPPPPPPHPPPPPPSPPPLLTIIHPRSVISLGLGWLSRGH